MATSSFTSVAVAAKASVLVEQGSKFIAILKSVETLADVKNFVESVRKENNNATHYCYAYILQPNNKIRREKAVDDGEPLGTAGQPLLNILKQKNIANACLIVVRYFGGVLLGANGLIRSYSQAAEKAVKGATYKICNFSSLYELELEYTEVKKFENFVKEKNGVVLDLDYAEVVYATVGFIEADAKKNVEDLQNEIGRKLTLKNIGQRYV